MGTFQQNVRFAVRQLGRNRGFTATVVLTLALSIGANTAVFSVLNALMLKRLPYFQPEKMGTIYTRIAGPHPEDERHHINGEQWELLRDDVPSLISAISATGTSGVNLQAGSHVQYVHAGRVSARYFDVLGIRPVIGRNFYDVEDRPHGPQTAIVSYGLWRTVFGSDPNVSGKKILLKGEPFTVVGVLPEGATTPLNANLYTPLQASQEGEGGGTNFDVITRLRDGATWQRADAQINRAWSRRNNKYELEDNPGAQVSYYSVPLQKGQTATLRPQIVALMLAAAFILLIACANLAGLTLVRMQRRVPEVATRMALGATAWQIQKQFWVEALLLASIGGIAGVLVGYAALRGVIRLLPEYFLPSADLSLDGRVLAFAAVVSLVTSVLFGMIPALAARRFDLRSAIASRGVTVGNWLSWRQALIAGEVALTVVLLAGSGLLIRTLIHLQTLPSAVDAPGVMAAMASLDDARFHNVAAFQKILNESTTAMRRIPGVEDAAVGLTLPYDRTLNDGITLSDGSEAGQQVMTGEVYITPDYFATLQIPILRGRAFTDGDSANTQHVAIVNREFARKFYRGENPIGHYVDQKTLIVGMVENVAVVPGLNFTAPLAPEEMMYIPATQVDAQSLVLLHTWFQPSWIVRTTGPITGLTGEMQSALSGADPNLLFSGFYKMDDLRERSLAMQWVEVTLLGSMAALALLLSAVGVFALVASMVAQKTREIGIRMALGSTTTQAIAGIGAPGMRATGMGVFLGLLLCIGALQAMRSVLYGIEAYDPRTIVTVVLLLGCVSLFAAIVPALRIAKIDPAETLRAE